ncbi:MAG: Stp1/IreP family PP2C-type Ser/Thr phosphatase [Actinobacteria bacterium]|nr:Stp1/IreP family PP2C-type Ser/Thr phosphatase [Actinomycetota bacterium]
MEYFADTDIGKYREKNEDYLYAENNLFIVADGMGGHMAGEVASRIAVEAFIENFNSSLKGISKKISANKITDNPGSSQVKELLLKSIKSANREVYSKATLQPGYYGMGTTFTGCYIQQDKVYTIHVGDSRLYIKRGSEFNLLTSDHTIVGELFRRGEISYEQTFNHPQRNYLTNVLGVAKDIDPDFNSFKVLPEDILLLCSDGLNSMLKDEDIANIIDKYKDAKDIAKNLIKGAIKKGGLDNITVIVVKI